MVVSTSGRADVIVQERSSFDLMAFKAHASSTEMTAADKQRRDSDFHCEGLLSILCGNAQSGEIIRLDRELIWNLEPKNKEYRETRFPTDAEREAAERETQATLEKLKSCPAPQVAPASPDTSKCEMSPPKLEVRPTDQHASFIGHDARLTQLALTASCRNPQSGDTCDFVMTFDSWLTQDELPGVSERKAFQSAYLHKLGIDDPNSLMQKQVRQFLAPYQSSLKELASKASDLQGYPLKTTVRIGFGGEQCAAAKQRAERGDAPMGNPLDSAGQAAASAVGSTVGNAAGKAAGNSSGGSVLGTAAGTLGSKLIGGLFNRKKPAAAAASTSAAPASNLYQVAEFSVETTAISTDPIQPVQFDIPPGWKLVKPKSEATKGKEFKCPGTGAAGN